MPASRLLSCTACCLVFSALFSTGLPALAEEAPSASRPRVGLVLSGGGARGLAHIGVIRELERQRVPVDCIAGTSMGGIVGGVYASGMPIDDIERSAREIDWTLAFQERPDRSSMRARRKRDENGHFARPEFGIRQGEVIAPAGVIYGQNLSHILFQLSRRAIGIAEFDRLPIPFRAIATDIATGQPVVLDHGALSLALRATMSVPAVMAPVERDGKLLIDGGLVDNLPTGTARKLCAEVLIAVNLGTPLLSRQEIGSAVSVGLQMVNILTEQNVNASLASLGPKDVLITPKLDALTAGDFDRLDDFVAAGEAATRLMAPQLAALAVPAEQFAAWKARRDRPDAEDFHYDEARIAPLKHVNPEALLAEIRAIKNPGSGKALLDQARRFFERGDFERAQVDIGQETDGERERRIAVLTATEKSWGPDYLRFGLSMIAQTGESTSFNALVGYTRTWLNPLGARWQTVLQIGESNLLHSEFLQPLATGSPFFVAPRLLLSHEASPVYIGNDQLERVSRTQNLVALEAGTEFGRSGAARLGVLSGQESYRSDIGVIVGSSGWQRLSATTARVDIDAFDKAHFPTHGYRALLDFYRSHRTLGVKQDFNRSVVELSAAETWQRNTFSALAMASRADTSAPLFDQIAMGGFQRLSAYPVGRFRASRVDFAKLGYQRNIPPLLGLNLGGIVSQTYFGGTLEAARIAESLDPLTRDDTYRSASLFIGADTIIGPAAFSFGFGNGGERSVWLSIGIPWSKD